MWLTSAALVALRPNYHTRPIESRADISCTTRLCTECNVSGGSSTALSNLVHALVVPYQRALAGWLPREITPLSTITCPLYIAPLAISNVGQSALTTKNEAIEISAAEGMDHDKQL